jgi:trehalose 6-phosphate phosphatase
MLFLKCTAEDYSAWMGRLSGASESLLILDFDGTLAPFRVARNEARPYPGISDMLEAIASSKRCRIVVVSGRGVEELSKLLQTKRPLELWGSHGWEQMNRDGTIHSLDPGEGARAGLKEAEQILISAGLDRRCERKHASIALHWRGLDEVTVRGMRERVTRAWDGVAIRNGLIVRSFDGGLEIMAIGRDKGHAVREILGSQAPDPIAAYLGDDLTDEDAFEALRPQDLGILVNEQLRQTAADIWIRPPDELFAFLHSWLEAVGVDR